MCYYSLYITIKMSNEWQTVNSKNRFTESSLVEEISNTKTNVYSKAKSGVIVGSPVFARPKSYGVFSSRYASKKTGDEKQTVVDVEDERSFPSLGGNSSSEKKSPFSGFKSVIQKRIEAESNLEAKKQTNTQPTEMRNETFIAIPSFRKFYQKQNSIGQSRYEDDKIDNEDYDDYVDISGEIQIRRKKNQPITDKFLDVTRISIRRPPPVVLSALDILPPGEKEEEYECHSPPFY